jgi:hypothetical protein
MARELFSVGVQRPPFVLHLLLQPCLDHQLLLFEIRQAISGFPAALVPQLNVQNMQSVIELCSNKSSENRAE